MTAQLPVREGAVTVDADVRRFAVVPDRGKAQRAVRDDVAVPGQQVHDGRLDQGIEVVGHVAVATARRQRAFRFVWDGDRRVLRAGILLLSRAGGGKSEDDGAIGDFPRQVLTLTKELEQIKALDGDATEAEVVPDDGREMQERDGRDPGLG